MLTVHDLIKHSIKKWERLTEISEEEFPVFRVEFNPLSTCTLCIEYRFCTSCPVYKETKVTGCEETPYPATERFVLDNNYKAWLSASKEEVKFLKKVLKNTENFDVPDAQGAIDIANKSLKTLEASLKTTTQE